MTAFVLEGCLVEDGLGLGHWELKAQRGAHGTAQSFMRARLGWNKADAPPTSQRYHVIHAGAK